MEGRIITLGNTNNNSNYIVVKLCRNKIQKTTEHPNSQQTDNSEIEILLSAVKNDHSTISIDPEITTDTTVSTKADKFISSSVSMM